MPRLPLGLLPALIFGVWFLWAWAAIAEKRAGEIRRGIPAEKRGGVSIMPIIPLFPLVFWGAACLVDVWFAPWGSLVIAGLHLVLALPMIFTVVRDVRFCRRYERT